MPLFAALFAAPIAALFGMRIQCDRIRLHFIRTPLFGSLSLFRRRLFGWCPATGPF